RIEYWGLGLIVGKPAEQPDRACCRSIALQWRLRNWSALSSKRTLSCMPTSANVPGRAGAAAGTTTGGAGSAGVGEGAAGAGGAGSLRVGLGYDERKGDEAGQAGASHPL